jgi:Cu/Ag efflux pump CusA
VDGYPGLVRDVQTYLKERIREVLTGSREPITVRIFGRELPVLRAKAQEVREALEKIPGIVEAHVESQAEIPQIEIKLNLAAAEGYDIKPGDVRRASAALVSGTEVGDIFRNGKAYDVNVWSTPETRNDLHAIRSLLIDTPKGGHVRLADVADVNVVPAPNMIKREQMMRKIDVGAKVRGRDLGSVVTDVKRALATVDFPREYHPELLGEYAEREAAQNRMQGFMVISAIGILFLLQVSFANWRLAMLGFLALPAALVGGVLAAYFGGGIVGLGSLVGFLTVLGIAARNGIMLISHYQHLEDKEGVVLGPDLIIRGARERISPIMMTALTTALTVAPLVIAGSIPGQEIEHPMAIVILGGLITSTLLNLFVIPPLYLRFAASGKRPSHGALESPKVA